MPMSQSLSGRAVPVAREPPSTTASTPGSAASAAATSATGAGSDGAGAGMRAG